MTPILQVRNVSKRYEEALALEDVSFEVFPGETVMLVGPSDAASRPS